MAWTTITNNIAWQAAAFLNEYVDAVSERDDVVGAPGVIPTTVSVGGDIQSAIGIIKQLQVYVTNSGDLWLDPSVSDYNDDAAMPTEMTLSELYIAAEIDDGFRRATTIPSDWEQYDDVAFSYGTIQTGDIIGPWIFADLQAALNVLTRTNAVNADYAVTGVYSGDSGGSVHASYAAAITAATTDWQAQADSTTSSPLAYTDGYVNAMTGWGALANRQRTTVQIDASPAGQDRTVTWYMKSIKMPILGDVISAFDAQTDKRLGGVDVIVEDVWNEMVSDTFTGFVGDHVSTEEIGSVVESVLPSFATDPWPDYVTSRRGWMADGDPEAIADWDFNYK